MTDIPDRETNAFLCDWVAKSEVEDAYIGLYRHSDEGTEHPQDGWAWAGNTTDREYRQWASSDVYNGYERTWILRWQATADADVVVVITVVVVVAVAVVVVVVVLWC